MPNWCASSLTVSGSPTLLRWLRSHVENGEIDDLFSSFFPTPPVLSSIHTGLYRDPATGQEISRWREVTDEDGEPVMDEDGRAVRQPVTDEEVASLTAEYGAADWWEWCWLHWGTKWNPSGPARVVYDDGDNLRLSFETAWAPPTAFCKKLSHLCPDARIYLAYAEAGQGLFGHEIIASGDVVHSSSSNSDFFVLVEDEYEVSPEVQAHLACWDIPGIGG